MGARISRGSRLASRWAARFGGGVLEVLLPPVCPRCGRLTHPSGFCSDCLIAFPRLPSPACPRCALPFGGTGPDHPCPRCRAEPPPFEGAVAWGLYRGGLLEAVQGFKFGGRLTLRAGLEGLARDTCRRGLPDWSWSAVVPVPCNRSTLARRGADLPALLARAVALELGAPWRPTALAKREGATALVGLGARERERAVRRAYLFRENLSGDVLILDDVMTTTATARAAATACRKAGADRVWVLALARTPKGLLTNF